MLNSWDESEHPRDDDGKFTFKNKGGENSSPKTPAKILYSKSIKQKEIKEKEKEYKGKLLNILGDKATAADVLYGDADKLKKKIKEAGIMTGGASGVGNSTKENWQKPVEYTKVNSEFGMRYHPILKRDILHAGVDLKIKQGTPVKSPLNGVVEFSGVQKGYGYVVIINHGTINGETTKTKYAHLSKMTTKKGDSIKAGESIGLSGGKPNTPGAGYSTGEHLHFEVIKNNIPVNPMNYLRH